MVSTKRTTARAWLAAGPISLLWLVAAVSPLAAQETPAGLLKQDAANPGSVDVAKEGFQEVKQDDGAEDTTSLHIQAGALLSRGNSDALSANASSKFKLRRGANQGAAAAAVNYQRADGKDSAFNIQGMARYDRFLSKRVTLFLALNARHDKFQGVDLRLNVDPGVAYYFIVEEKHSLWAELGYDLEHEIRRDAFIDDIVAQNDAAMMMTPPGELLTVPDKTETSHNVRAFVGYDNQLNEAVLFNTGIEYLQSVQHTDAFRLNWASGLTSKVGGDFSVGVTITLSYDNDPLEGVESTDVTTAVNLTYALL